MTSKSSWMTGLQYQRRRPLLAGVSLVLLLATWFVASMVRPSIAQDPNKPKPAGKIRKPSMADTIRANIYADNWFMLYN